MYHPMQARIDCIQISNMSSCFRRFMSGYLSTVDRFDRFTLDGRILQLCIWLAVRFVFSNRYDLWESTLWMMEFVIDLFAGIGCKVAGFLTAFATHLSVFTLTLVTIERWYAITHAIYLNKRLKLKTASCIMICGWVYSIVMSTLPLFGFSNYSSTRYCCTFSSNRNIRFIFFIFTFDTTDWLFRP